MRPLCLLPLALAACSQTPSTNGNPDGAADAAIDAAPADAAPDFGLVPPSRDGGLTSTAIPFLGTPPGIGFDDLRFSPDLKQVVAPAGRTGTVALFDPATLVVADVTGFGSAATFGGMPTQGPTSADYGRGFLYVVDRTRRDVDVVDPKALKILSIYFSPAGAGYDYVRWVDATGEVWVTEPSSAQIEILSVMEGGAAPILASAGFVSVAGGPESLAIDSAGGVAYTHALAGKTFSIDVHARAITNTWANGCTTSRGIALDAARGFLFVACEEGSLAVLDVAHGGAILGTLAEGMGLDGIGYSATLAHLYVPGAASGTFAVVGVSKAGALSLLGRAPVPLGAHCAVADDHAQAWVCDPMNGRLLVFADPFPPSGN